MPCQGMGGGAVGGRFTLPIRARALISSESSEPENTERNIISTTIYAAEGTRLASIMLLRTLAISLASGEGIPS